jgi:hypothetical protein
LIVSAARAQLYFTTSWKLSGIYFELFFESGIQVRIMNLLIRAILTSGLLALGSPAFCQQDYVGRFDIYGGFTFLDSPHINLWERGFQFQTGVRMRSWLTLGFDYSVVTGHTSLTPDLLTTELQQQLNAQLARLAAVGLIPANYALSIPLDSTTQNFAAGPQFSYHHWEAVTLFIRPSIGAVYESATPRPADPIAAAIVNQLAPSGKKEDWTGFYGFGGGIDLNVTRHVALRIQADFVHDHLFSDLLKDGRNTIRVGIGPAFQFGRNVAK